MTTANYERAARALWVQWGGYAKYTKCAACGEHRYCRSAHGGAFLCLDCFDITKGGRLA